MVEQSYTGGVNATGYTPDVQEDLGMINKIAHSIIRNVEAFDPLNVFNKLPVDKGTTVEQVVVGLAEATAYNKDGGATEFFENYPPNMSVRYFDDYKHLIFPVDIKRNEIRKVLTKDNGVEELATKIVASLTEGDKYDKFTRTKGLLKWARDNSIFKKLTDVTKTNYTEILLTIKNAVSGMKFVNADYNTSGLKRRTRNEDIFIIMPYTVKNSIDVNELAGVFNLSKAEIENKIIEIDEGDTIYIVDQNAILIYTQLYEMYNWLDINTLDMKYKLHVERMYATSPLFDACYFNLTAGQ